MKFWRIAGNSRTNKIVRQRVTTAPKERFGRFSAVETVETPRRDLSVGVERRRRAGDGGAQGASGEERGAKRRVSSFIKINVAALINILMTKTKKNGRRRLEVNASETILATILKRRRNEPATMLKRRRSEPATMLKRRRKRTGNGAPKTSSRDGRSWRDVY